VPQDASDAMPAQPQPSLSDTAAVGAVPAAVTPTGVRADVPAPGEGEAKSNSDPTTAVALPGAPGAVDMDVSRWRSLSKSGNNDQVQVELAWKDLHLSVGSKHILKDLNGVIRPGKLTAIMGTHVVSACYVLGGGAVVVHVACVREWVLIVPVAFAVLARQDLRELEKVRC